MNKTTRKRLLNCYVFSVLKYGYESWTVNKNLMKRINAFEQWCCRRMLKISWKDKVPNREVLKRVVEKERQFSRKIVQQKLAYAGHVLRGSSGRNALVILLLLRHFFILFCQREAQTTASKDAIVA